MFDFIILALIAGIGLSLSLGILGNLIYWKRISYLSDSIAHSSLLGASLGLLIPIAPDLIIIVICFVSSFAFVYLNKKANFTTDVILVLNTQTMLALGILLVGIFAKGVMINSYFFGSILSLSRNDVYLIYILALLTLIYIFFNWEKILLNTISYEIATSEKIHGFLQDVFFMFLLSCIITFSIKFAGILLIPAITILPALIANQIAKTPIKSLLYSFLISSSCISLGILTSTIIDVTTGSLITLYLILVLIIQLIIKHILVK